MYYITVGMGNFHYRFFSMCSASFLTFIKFLDCSVLNCGAFLLFLFSFCTFVALLLENKKKREVLFLSSDI